MTRNQRCVQLVERDFHGDRVACKIDRPIISGADICVVESAAAAGHKMPSGGSTVDKRRIARSIGTCPQEELVSAIRKPEVVVTRCADLRARSVGCEIDTDRK